MSRHHSHGAENRFQVVADYIADQYWTSISYITDVAGGHPQIP